MKLGRYRHYKGGEYLVLGVAQDANAGNLAPADNAGRPIGSALEKREVVVYVALYASDRPAMWARSREEFDELLCVKYTCPQYGSVVVAPVRLELGTEGYCPSCASRLRPRFKYVEELESS